MAASAESAAERNWRLLVCRRAHWRCEWSEQGKRCFRAAPHYRVGAVRIGPNDWKCFCTQHAAAGKFDRFLAEAIQKTNGATRRREALMTPKLQSLANKLRDVRGSIEKRADGLLARLDKADAASAEIDAKAHAEIDKIEAATRDVEDLVAQMGNGGPPLDRSDGSSQH